MASDAGPGRRLPVFQALLLTLCTVITSDILKTAGFSAATIFVVPGALILAGLSRVASTPRRALGQIQD